jgi:alkyl hydroperoxide reductase subunit AhpC
VVWDILWRIEFFCTVVVVHRAKGGGMSDIMLVRELKIIINDRNTRIRELETEKLAHMRDASEALRVVGVLRAALRKYGVHDRTCPAGLAEPRKCRCGRDAALGVG